jgi:hypothetical protein
MSVNGINSTKISGTNPDMEVSNINKTTTGKVGDRPNMGTPVNDKSAGSSPKVADKGNAADKGDAADKSDAADKGDVADKGDTGGDPENTGLNEGDKKTAAKGAISAIGDLFTAAFGKDNKSDVANNTGSKGKDADANGADKKGEAGKEDVAKLAKDTVNNIASIAGVGKGDVASTKGTDKDVKTSGKGETNKFDAIKNKDALIAKLAGNDDSSNKGGFMGVFNVDSKKSDNELKMAAIKAISNKEDSIA